MRWQSPVGKLIFFIGAFMIGWGILGMIGILDHGKGYELLISESILFVGGLFFSLLGEKSPRS